MTTAEIKILQYIRDKNVKYIARDIDGSLFAYKNMPTLDPIEKHGANSKMLHIYATSHTKH